jgi:beta-lactamase regulating signal transducer with metallopeptidase domain
MITPSAVFFSIAAALSIWVVGRRDVARAPKLTVTALALLAAFPVLSLLPKIPVSQFPEPGAAWAAWLGWIWLAGVIFFCFRLLLALCRLCLWRRISHPVTDDGFRHHHPEIRVLDKLASPVAVGVMRPLILVPESWHQWPSALKQTVIDHESTHHARRDPLWRTIAAIACTLHWYNPLCWWMAGRLAHQCEFACDEAVVKNGRSIREYIHDLCDVAAHCRTPETSLAMARRSGLESRVRRMLEPPLRASRAGILIPVMLVLLSAMVLAMLDSTPVDIIPAIDPIEIRTRLNADPFPGG